MRAKKLSILVLFIVFAFVAIGFGKAIALDNAPFEGVYSKCALSIFSVVSKPIDGFIRCCILRSEGPNKGKIDCITCEEGKADTTCVESTHKKTAVRPKIPGGATPGQFEKPKGLTPAQRARRAIMKRNPGQKTSNTVVENPPTVKVPQSRFTPHDVAPSRKEFSNRRNFRFNRPAISKPAWNAYQRCLAKQKRGMKISCNKPKR